MSLIESFLKEGAVQGTGKEVFIAIRIDGAIGSGTVEDPYNGATHTFLDDLLANRNGTRTSITENMTIRFGPGIFQTKGFGNISALGWQPFSGQRLIGSGIHQTTLQLVKAQGFSDSGSFQGVISTNANVSDIEISDMTLD